MLRSMSAALIIVGAVCPASGQATSSASAHPVNLVQAYTAEFKTTVTRTLSNGTIITRESTRVDAIDSQGRYLVSETEAPNFDSHTYTRVHVADLNFTYIDWDSGSRKARVTQYPPIAEQHGCWDDDAGIHRNFGGEQPRVHPNPTAKGLPHTDQEWTSEDLGTMKIMGMEVHGQRRSHTIPIGKIGNDRPIIQMSESWVAPALRGLELRRIDDDPLNGTTAKELIKLDLSEPPLSAFQPPDGYEVVHIEFHKVPCPNP